MKASDIKKQRAKAIKAVFRLLKYRQRSEKEIRDRLKIKKFSNDTINQTVDYLRELQLIDDRHFTRSWIADRLTKPIGLRRISYELKQKGIERDILQEELKKAENNYSEEDVVEKLAKKRMERYKGIDQKRAKKRTIDYLTYKGFNPETIQNVTRKL